MAGRSKNSYLFLMTKRKELLVSTTLYKYPLKTFLVGLKANFKIQNLPFNASQKILVKITYEKLIKSQDLF